jgi:hypothetical protein
MPDLRHALSGIGVVPVDRATVQSYSHQDQFTALSYDLFRETTQWVAFLAGVTRDERGWTREEAILGGQLVRLMKCCRGILEEGRSNEHYFLTTFFRMAAETGITLRYLIRFGSPELFDSYVKYSLQTKVDIVKRVEENIARRGSELPIERRILDAASRAFSKSGVRTEDMPSTRMKNWGGKNTYEKAEALGLANAYVGIFASPSSGVHGDWLDLLSNHLSLDEGSGLFLPELSAGATPAEPLLVLADLSAVALIDYASHLGGSDMRSVAEQLAQLQERIRIVNEEHERFIAQNRAG